MQSLEWAYWVCFEEKEALEEILTEAKDTDSRIMF